MAMRGDDYVDDEPEGREEGLMMMELEQPADDDEVLGQYYVARREMLAQTLQRRKKWIVGGAATCLVVVLLLGIVAMAVRNQGHGGNGGGGEMDGPRLPDYVRPNHYDLHIMTDMTAFTFKGTAEIDITVTKKGINQIVLHALDLDISEARLQSADKLHSEDADEIRFDKANDFLILEFASLSKWLETSSEFVLQLTFNGTLKTSMSGFYRSSYVVDGKTEWLAVTDFEPTDARRAFPCFDEPAMKANFTITLTYPVGYQGISNMQELGRTTSPTRIESKFATSVRMSTYLVCYSINKFESIQTTTTDGKVKVRVWTTPDTISQAEYALEVGKYVLGNYTDYYGIPFPLSKLDLIAIPDYSAGAMENWGLITFRQTALLYDPQQSSSSDKQRVAVVIAHELAHQWFGNLVTMKWWNDLWLNEGFASFMEYKGVNFIHPDWSMWEQFLYDDRSTAMDLDALRTSHAIAVDVKHPSEIGQLFDSISYSKGASIIRMLEAYLGTFTQAPRLFQNGIHDYLEAHKYGNAETAQLWQAVSDATESVGRLDIATMMNTWTSQVGFPYLQLTPVPGQRQLDVTQRRFLVNGNKSHEDATLWWVPFVYKTFGGAPTLKPLPKTRSERIPFDASRDGYVLGNVGQAGYYRVLYPASMYDAFRAPLSQLPNSPIQALDRAGLVDDMFAFAQAGLTTPVAALELTQFLERESDYTVWAMALDGLNGMGGLLRYEDCYGRFQKHVLSLMGPALLEVGWTPSDAEPHLTKLLRSLLLANAVSLGHQPSIDTAKELFKALVATGREIPQDLRNAVYRAGVATGGLDAYEWMLQRYQTANVAAEKLRALSALAYAREPYLLQRTLRLSLSPLVRSQDTVRVVALVANNPAGTALAWEFFRDNYRVFYERYGGGHFLIESLIKAVTTHFSTEAKLAEVNQFFKDHFVEGGSRAIEQSVETIEYRIHWLATNLATVDAWLTAHT